MGDPSGWREPFERALDADPSDQRVRRDLADHLDELGDPDGEPVRWLADHDKWPRPPGRDEIPTWDWYQGHGAHRYLPGGVFDQLSRYAGHAESRHRMAGTYDTRREAEADFCRAFHAAREAGWGPDSG
jgi:hypothetical protein